MLFYIAFNSQGHIAMGSLWVEETSANHTVNHRASASNYQLSNMKRPGPRFELAASEVGGENSNRYTTEPPDTIQEEKEKYAVSVYARDNLKLYRTRKYNFKQMIIHSWNAYFLKYGETVTFSTLLKQNIYIKKN